MIKNRHWEVLKAKLELFQGQISQFLRLQFSPNLHAKQRICLVCGIVAIFTVSTNCVVSKELGDYPNQLTRDGALVVFPDRGTLYVATDFHARWADFNQWLSQTRLVERLEAGEDVYGLILGDVVDHKTGDPIIEPLGDEKIVNRILQLQAKFGAKGARIIHLIGNHEFAVADAYRVLRKRGMTTRNRQRAIEQLYRGPEGLYYQQFNFLERMTDKHHEYLMGLPTVAIGKNGFVGVHAGVSSSTKSLADLVNPSSEILEGLLWSRPSIAVPGGYTPLQTASFLRRIGGSILAVGHTPLSYLPEASVRDGVARLRSRQLVFATGHGAVAQWNRDTSIVSQRRRVTNGR